MDVPLGVPTFLSLSLRVGSMLFVDHIRDQRYLRRQEQLLLDRAVEEEERLQWSKIKEEAEWEADAFHATIHDAIDLNRYRLLLGEGEDFITDVCGESYSTAHHGWTWET